jgi:hypothetical protein
MNPNNFIAANYAPPGSAGRFLVAGMLSAIRGSLYNSIGVVNSNLWHSCKKIAS